MKLKNFPDDRLKIFFNKSDFYNRLLRAGLFVLVIVCMLSLNSQTPALGMAPTQPADIPVTVVSEYFNEWTLNSGLLYWAGRCTGGEQRWSANLKRMPTYASIAGMIATVDSNHCLTYMQMAADSQGVYYYDEDGGNRIQSRSSATPYTETTVFNLPVGMYPVGERLAVDGDYVYWLTNGGQLVRVRKDNADFGIVASGLSSPKDLVVVGNIAYWLEATGLWRADVNCVSLPCTKGRISLISGSHLLYYYVSRPFLQAGPRLVYVSGQTLHRVSCSDFQVNCSESNPYTVPVDGNPWELGRPATDGVNLFWQEGYFNIAGSLVGRLRRMPVAGGVAPVDIAVNLFYTPGPVYLDNYNIYFTSVDSTNYVILKLPINANALVRDLSADALEVTQAIQSPANDVPLVSDKTTYVRAYSKDVIGPSAYAVDAYLYGSRNGSPLPGSPLHPLNGKLAVLNGTAYDRAQLNAGWYFKLPPSWIETGTTSLRVVVDPNQSYSDSNRVNNEANRDVIFQQRKTVCTIFIPVHTHAPLPSTNIANFWQMMDYAKRLWPTADLRSYKQDMSVEELEVCSWHGVPYPCFGPYELPNDTWKVFTSLSVRDAFTDVPTECEGPSGETHYVGMVSPETETGTTTGTGMTSVFNVLWVKFSNDLAAAGDPFSPISGETLAHEMAHNNGRAHVNCGNPDGVDNNYPYPTNQIDFLGGSNHYGFDIKSLRPIAPGAANDFMGYCTPKWTSDYTWQALYNSLSTNAPVSAGPAAVDLTSAANSILISGAITPTAGTGEIGYAWNYPVAALSASSLAKWQRLANAGVSQPANFGPESQEFSNSELSSSVNVPVVSTPAAVYHIQLLGAASQVLSDTPISPTTPDIHALPSLTQVFLAVFPAPVLPVVKIQLMQDAIVLDSFSPGSKAPVVHILSPTAGQVVSNQFSVSWTGQDGDTQDSLHYTVQYSPDSGLTWRSLAADIVGRPDSNTNTLSFQNPSIPGSLPNGALVRVAASDGYHTTLALSPAFTVNNRKPQPFVISPGAGETSPANQPVVLSGAASDAEDGSISGSGLSWTVDNQPAGSGEQTNLAGLAPGTHAIVLTARDSVSQTATAQAALTILPLAIPSSSTPTMDGLCDDAAYGGASQVLLQPYASGDQASVRLLRDSSSVWACFTGLLAGANTSDFAGLRLDIDHSQDALAQSTDPGFFVRADGSPFSLAGNGVGGFTSPAPANIQGQVSGGNGHWSAEMRIDSTLLGGLDHLIGLSAGHYDLNTPDNNFVWPYTSSAKKPNTWGTTALGSSPTISGLSQTNALVGDLGFTLVISGSNFLAGSQVLWNNALLPTIFTSSNVISATVNAAQLSTAGIIPIVVRNPITIDSAPAQFKIANPLPVISSLQPTSIVAGKPTFQLVVQGSGFVSGAKVLWNGQEAPTTFVNSARLDAQINASLISEGQVISITVLNPGPDATVSEALPFTIKPNHLVFLPFVHR